MKENNREIINFFLDDGAPIGPDYEYMGVLALDGTRPAARFELDPEEGKYRIKDLEQEPTVDVVFGGGAARFLSLRDLCSLIEEESAEG